MAMVSRPRRHPDRRCPVPGSETGDLRSDAWSGRQPAPQWRIRLAVFLGDPTGVLFRTVAPITFTPPILLFASPWQVRTANGGTEVKR